MIDISEAVAVICVATQIDPGEVTRITILPGLLTVDTAHTMKGSLAENQATFTVITYHPNPQQEPGK